MEDDKLDALCSVRAEGGVKMERSAVSDFNGYGRAGMIWEGFQSASHLPRDGGLKLYAETVPSKLRRFEKRRAASSERVEDPITGFCVPQHQLTGNLGNEVAPIPGRMPA